MFKALTLAAALAASPAHAGCASLPEFSQLDFWVGTWRVTAQGQYAGTDVVRRILGGCAVTEDWTDADGSHGMSLFYFDAFSRQWQQVWVTDRATYRGGLKMKRLIAVFPGGGVRFEGILPGAPGSRTILDRTTLTPLRPGRVRQVIQISGDGGSTWKTTFDALYARKP